MDKEGAAQLLSGLQARHNEPSAVLREREGHTLNTKYEISQTREIFCNHRKHVITCACVQYSTSHSIERKQFGGIEVPVVDPRSNLHPREAELFHAAPHLHHCQVRGLHGQSAQAHKPLGVAAHRIGQIVVQEDAEIQCVMRFGLKSKYKIRR